jgi:predicted choloylglycine hydrolase
LTPTLPFLDSYSAREARQALAYFETYCPGIRDEIQGAADAFGVPLEQIAFLGGKNKGDGSSPIPVGRMVDRTPQPRGKGHCSQFAVLPAASADGHLYVGQNTDCGPQDLDLRLCTTRVEGKPAHIGTSDMIFGRGGGVNEHGLCITTSWGAPGVWLEGEGLPYFAVVRALLDGCRSVGDAVAAMDEMPIAWCTNFILADRSGEVTLVEVAYAHRAVKRVQAGAEDAFLCATNHYTLPAMRPYDTARRRQSVTRYRIIQACLDGAGARISKGLLRKILSEPLPRGVCLHHYSSGLGTLWSTLFDVTDVSVEICFGAPSSDRNPWRTIGLHDPVGTTEYMAHLPDAPVPPGFWERLPPGSEG